MLHVLLRRGMNSSDSLSSAASFQDILQSLRDMKHHSPLKLLMQNASVDPEEGAAKLCLCIRLALKP